MLTHPPAPPADEAFEARERAEALHVEIERLPAAFRRPVVLCYLEGLTVHEAARRLRCSHGTVRSRIARGREKLRVALSRRGVVLSTAAMAAALDARPASAVSSLLCDATARAALAFAARHATSGAPAAPLAREVLRSMLIHRLRFTALTALLLGAVGAGMSLLGAPAGPREGGSRAQQAARAEPRPPDPIQPAPGRMFVVGRVLDPQGKPVPNATVGVAMRRKLLFAGIGSEGAFAATAGHGESDASGVFRLDAPRTSSAHHALFLATAIAPGHGIGWAELDPDEDQPGADITLPPEQVIEGRLFDLQGRPVPGAVISVSAIWRDLPPTVLGLGRVVESHTEGPSRWWGRVHDGPGWPSPAKSDAEGRFTLRGIGRGLHATLSVLDPRFAPQTLQVDTDGPDGVKALKAALLPARTLTGRVTYADTGRPVSHAEVHFGAIARQGQGGTRVYLMAGADAEGRFRVVVMPGDQLNIWAAAPEGQPYRNAGKQLEWPAGATEQSIDLALPRGEVMIRGKVTEEGTGRPVAEALVNFIPSGPRAARNGAAGFARTKADGSFAFPAGRSPGHLAIQAPDEDYQLRVMGTGPLYEGTQGGRRAYAHAFLPCDTNQGTGDREFHITLRRGATVKFRLIGPDGQPARDVRVYSRAVLGPSAASATRGWDGFDVEVARRGRFAVHGLDEETEVPIHFLQPEGELGATVRVSGKMAARGPITVRLERCGTAAARLVGPDGRPVAGQPRGVSITMVVTPGPPGRSAPVLAGALAADEGLLGYVDPIHHGRGWIADAHGQITLPALIPGASYRITDRSARGDPQVRREFVVGPGQAAELGNVLVQRPAR